MDIILLVRYKIIIRIFKAVWKRNLVTLPYVTVWYNISLYSEPRALLALTRKGFKLSFKIPQSIKYELINGEFWLCGGACIIGKRFNFTSAYHSKLILIVQRFISPLKYLFQLSMIFQTRYQFGLISALFYCSCYSSHMIFLKVFVFWIPSSRGIHVVMAGLNYFATGLGYTFLVIYTDDSFLYQ